MNYMSYTKDVVCDDRYNKLLRVLNSIPYVSHHILDDNWIDIADELYSHITGKEPRYTSVLSLLVTMAISIEDEIMRDDDAGDRTADWFWLMIRNLGIDITDDEWDEDSEETIQKAVDIFVNRRYDRKGKGSLFPVKKTRKNVLRESIWQQAHYYFNENYRYEIED